MKHETLKKTIQDSRFKIQERGFTIVEVLVTSLIFSVMALAVSAIFIQIINIQRRGFSVQKIQDNSLLVLEEMSRDMRVSKISNQESPNCTASSITLVHPIKGTLVYQAINGIIQRSVSGGNYLDVSSSDVNFTRMNFCILGSLPNDNQSPRITVVMSVQNRIGKEILQMNIQTSVASRDVFDEFQNP